MGKRGNEKRKGEKALRIWEALRSPTPESSCSENSTVSERLARFDERAQYQICPDCQKVVMAQGSTESCCLKVRLALLTEDLWLFAGVHDYVDVTWESCRTEAKRRCGLGDTHTSEATEVEKTPRKTKRSATAVAKKKARKTKTSGAKKEEAGQTSKSAAAAAKKKVSKKNKEKANQLQEPVPSASTHVGKSPPSPPASWATR